MKYIALVSGGKDSTFNILQASNAGHELVAVVNLHPSATGDEEIDSYMFQTVGYKAIAAIAEALGVPLYRKQLSGDEDKVVDELVAVLGDALKDFPDARGVSVGAIASTYQQVRVDKAAQQLGLTSLAYLWQRDQRELLDEIIASGIDARIIKVAGAGLSEKHLGMSLAEVRGDLLRLHEQYGLHPCGEGGEYETLVLDGPQYLKRLEFTRSSVVKHQTGDVYYLSVDVALRDKSPTTTKPEFTVPPLLQKEFAELVQKLELDTASAPPAGPFKPRMPRQLERQIRCENLDPIVSLSREGRFAFFVRGNIDDVFGQLQGLYAKHGKDKTGTVHVTVLLRDMDTFGRLNEKYNELFNFDGPPSRAAVQTKIGDEVYVTAFGGPPDRSGRGLHVQGRSYWAPANIGPYSQARIAWGQSYLAGQIGLVPASLELHPDPYTQAVLALQSAVRILDASHGKNNWRISVAAVFLSGPALLPIVQKLWDLFSAGKSVPLIVLEVERLPRDAQVEWLFQAFDEKYYSRFTPDTDEAEEGFVWPPKFEKATDEEYGYSYDFGFQRLRVGPTRPADADDATAVVYSTRLPEPAFASFVPTKRVHLGTHELPDVFGRPAAELWVSNKYAGPKDLVY